MTEEKYSINTLVALNLFDGKEVFKVDWESPGMGWWGMHATPTVVDGVIYLVDGPGQIHARQATDGKAIWKSAEQVRGRYAGPNASPIVHGERLFLLTQKGVLALSIKDGSLLWSTRGDKESVHYTEDNSPAIFQNGDKTVLVVPQGHDRGGFLCGLDAETGALVVAN